MLIYDVFENIAQYLSIEETVNFLLASRSNYEMYLVNKHYCDIVLNKKIFDFLDMDIGLGEASIYTSEKSKTIFRIYNYFRNHWKSSKSDYLIYMIDNGIDDLDLFRFFASKCTFRNIMDANEIRMVNYTGTIVLQDIEYSLISFNDMKYMLIYGDRRQLDILLETYRIPVCLLSYAINEVLISDTVLKKRCNKSRFALRSFIKYMFVNHCFGFFCSTDNTYIHSVLLMLIKYKRTDIVKYFLEKKRHYMTRGSGLDYHYLVNKCVEMQDSIHLSLLLEENSKDNRCGCFTKNYVIINTHHIIDHCKNARFSYIAFLVERCLGRAINTALYIESICAGVESLIMSKYFRDLRQLGDLARYFSQENIQILNSHLNTVYDSIGVSYDKRFYLSVEM